MGLGSLAKGFRKVVADNSAAILASLAVTGVVATSALVGRATFKAAKIIDGEQVAYDLEGNGYELDLRDKVKLVWREYIPAAGIAALTVASIVGGHRVQTNKIAALSAAYAFADRAFETYRDKVIEKIGERKNNDIRDEIAEERVREHFESGPAREVLVLPSEGELFYDMYSGRTFVSDMQSVREAAVDTNEKVYADYYASLNEFYTLIGLGHIKAGDAVGFNPDRKCQLVFTTTLAPDGRPCHAIDFAKEPTHTYQDFH